MSNIQMNKKAMKNVLKSCIKNLNDIKDDTDITCVIIQFKTKEDRYNVDFHINDANRGN